MTGRVTSVLRLRSLHVALLAALLLIIGGTQASADPGQTRFKIAWSPAVFDRLVQQAEQNPIRVEGALRPVSGEDIRMGTTGLLVIKEPSIFGPDKSWAGLSRALQKAIDGDASAFAAGPAGEPQYGYHGRLANACLDYAPQVHTYAEMQQRLRRGARASSPFR